MNWLWILLPCFSFNVNFNIITANPNIRNAQSSSSNLTIFLNNNELGARGGHSSQLKFQQTLYNYSEHNMDYTTKSMSFAQDQEDIWLYENFFYGMTNGLILESGALDGIIFSTSYFFEKFANWIAIHVEADIDNFQNLNKNRKKSININAALCNSSKPLHFANGRKKNPIMASPAIRGIIEFMDKEFIERWHADIYENRTTLEELPIVMCTTVKNILNQLHVEHVDLWILDVEGAEESALKVRS
eukprot:gene3099-6084_t